MKLRSTAVVLTLTLMGLAVGVPSPASAEADTTVGLWRMNEAAGSKVLVDSSGSGLHGTIGDDVDAGMASGSSTIHRYPYTEPNGLPVRPGHLNMVPHSPLLNPDSDDHAVTVRLRTTRGFGNIVQKGQSATAGGFFKIENNHGVITCLYRSSSGQGGVSSGRPLNDGQWHTVRCERTPDRVRMWVDGVVADSRAARTGRIANTWPLSIAGKSKCNQRSVGCDYFVGAIDYVRIEKQTPSTQTNGPTVLAATDFAAGIGAWIGVDGLSMDDARGSPDDGRPSVRARVEQGVATGRLPLSPASDAVCAEVDFRATRVGSESPYSLLKLRNDEGQSVARIRVDAAGNLSGRADVAQESFATSSRLEPRRWNRLGLCAIVGDSPSISLSVNGRSVYSWTGPTGSSPIAAVQLGDNSVRTATVHWDDLRVTSAA